LTDALREYLLSLAEFPTPEPSPNLTPQREPLEIAISLAAAPLGEQARTAE
jgi:hypothetical protein